jgi:hypothetical protein
MDLKMLLFLELVVRHYIVCTVNSFQLFTVQNSNPASASPSYPIDEPIYWVPVRMSESPASRTAMVEQRKSLPQAVPSSIWTTLSAIDRH